MVARWRHGAYRIVGLQFHSGTPRVDADQLASYLSQLQYFEFIEMPNSPASDVAAWRERLQDQYAVLHCSSHSQ